MLPPTCRLFFRLTWRSLGAGLFLAAVAARAIPPAQNYTWRSVPIGGGGLVSGLLFHPASPGLLYARTDVGGAYRWIPGESRWQPLNDALGRNDAELLGVVSFAVDAHDPQRLYLACGSYLPAWGKPAALLISSDQGVTWQRVPLPFHLGGNADGRTAGERLQVDPHRGQVLFLGTNQDGLWRSDDGGRNWAHLRGFPMASVTFVLPDPRSSAADESARLLYAGAGDLRNPALLTSADGGESWHQVPGQPRGLLVQHAALTAAGDLLLTYADGLGPNGTTRGAVWIFNPATGKWTDISPIHPNPSTRDNFSYAGLALDVRRPGTILVSTLDRWTFGDEIFRSTDGGASWKPLLAASTWDYSPAPYARTLKPHWIGQVALDPFDAGHALFITGYGVWATAAVDAVDHGATTPWRLAVSGLEETVPEQLVSPPAGAPLLSALADFTGFRHDTLDRVSGTGTFQPAYGSNPSIAFAEQLPARMVRTHSGPARGARSTDGGVTWRNFTATPPPARAIGPGVIAISADGRTLVWLPRGAGPYFSTDEGASWTASRADLVASTDFRVTGLVADRVDPAKFYVYHPTTGQVFVSLDGGRRFTPAAHLPADGGLLQAEPGAAGHVWVPAPDGLYRSTDAGLHFTAIGPVQAAFQVGFGRAAPGQSSPAIYLAGKVDGLEAFFRSDNGGDSWVALSNDRQRFGYPKVITGDPRVYGRVYLGTGGRGIMVGEPAQP